jgi:hypothetical protein
VCASADGGITVTVIPENRTANIDITPNKMSVFFATPLYNECMVLEVFVFEIITHFLLSTL